MSKWEKDIESVFQRIGILAKYSVKPYIMRHEDVYKSEYSSFYVAIASWCNQPSMFYSFPFRLFAQCRGMSNKMYSKYKRNISQYLIDVNIKGASWRAMEMVESKFPQIADKYFDYEPKRKVGNK